MYKTRVWLKQILLCYEKEKSGKWSIKRALLGWVWWLKLVVLALWEAMVGESRGQEFNTYLAKIMKPYL